MWFNYKPMICPIYNKSKFTISIQFLILRGVRTVQGYQHSTPLTTTPYHHIKYTLAWEYKFKFTAHREIGQKGALRCWIEADGGSSQIIFIRLYVYGIIVAGRVDIITFWQGCFYFSMPRYAGLIQGYTSNMVHSEGKQLVIQLFSWPYEYLTWLCGHIVHWPLSQMMKNT